MSSNSATSVFNCLYDSLVPAFVEDQVKIVKGEITVMLEKLYIGPASYRYKGPGDEFLKSRSYYTSTNPWELGRNLLIYGLIAGVGYLLVEVSFTWTGYGAIIGGGFLILSALHNFGQGNHLKKALQLLVTPMQGELDKGVSVSQDPLEMLEVLHLEMSKFTGLRPRIKKIVDFLLRRHTTEPDCSDSLRDVALENWTGVRRIVNKKNETVGVAFKQVGESTPVVATKKGKEKDIRVQKITLRAYYFGDEYFSRIHQTTQKNVTYEFTNVLKGVEIAGLVGILQQDDEIRLK